MSDLQIVLIIIGVLIVGAVLLLNWWQERKYHQQVENGFADVQKHTTSKLPSDALTADSSAKVAPQAVPFSDTYSFPDEDNNEIDDDIDEVSETLETPEIKPFDTTIEEELNGFSQTHFSNTIVDDAKEDLDLQNLEVAATKVSPRVAEATRIEPTFSAPFQPITPPSELPVEPIKDAALIQRDDIKAIFEDAFKQNATPIVTASESPEASVAPENVQDSMTLPARLHGQIDLIAVMYLPTETQIADLTQALAGLTQQYDKPTFVHVLTVQQDWLALNEAPASVVVTRIACSLQLADRGGAVSRSTLNRFQLAVESAGLDFNAHVEWQSTGDALNIANALDAFCIEVDKTVGFHLVHGENGAFTGTKLRGLAEAQGFAIAPDGTFKYIDNATQQTAFIMINQDNHPFSPEMLRTSVVKGVSFQLDIPHVKNCAEAFGQMVQVAKQMEIGLNAVLIDDNQKILGDMQIEKIRQQLKVIHAKMLVRGIIPGSESAKRLFS